MEQHEETPLKPLLVERIRKEGRLTFDQFMAACLYEPGLGYYTSPGRKVGSGGDFYTSSNVHLMFGRLIAREICQMWRTMGCPAAFELVEVGAAGGRLARDVLDTIAELEGDFYAALTLRLIEAEPTLRDIQAEMLAPHRDKLVWSTPAELAEGGLRITGCIYSNELIDSFPVHLVEMTPEGLREVYVGEQEGEFGELMDLPSTPELERYLERVGIRLAVGQRAEINLAAVSWVESVARSLEQGFVLTIDYGYVAQELYGPMRVNGTLLCYYRHKVEENPFVRVGQQDITSHVDFSTLAGRGEELGLKRVWFGEQYRFLMGAGLMEEMMALESRACSEQERLKTRLSLKKLILPDGGMGDTFKVLIQAKGVDTPRLLCMRDWSGAF